MKKTLALGASAIAALGVIALPLASYAANSADVTLNVNINSAIGLTVDNATKSVDMNINETNETMKSTVTVTTNNAAGYKINVKDKDSSTALVNGAGTGAATIPAKDGAPVAGTAGWGIKGGDITTYKAVTAADVTFKTTAAPANAEQTVFTYGVATAADQKSGTYTDTIVFTAVAN